MESFTFLQRPPSEPQPIYVLHGDQSFLKHQSLVLIRRLVLGPNDDGLALTNHQGDKTTRAAVLEDLQTLPFVSLRRLVVVETADPFVSKERAWLEKYWADCKAKPTRTGVLVLDVKTWTSTTKLAKTTPDAWEVVCKSPKPDALPPWCVSWCQERHGKQITPRAAKLLVDLIGGEMGVLDQEMQKLVSYAGDAPQIDIRDVDQLVGHSRTETTWLIFDHIAAGKANEALTLFDHLIHQGEDAMMLLGAFRYQLGRVAMTVRLTSQGVPRDEALRCAGVPANQWAMRGAERLLRHLGTQRAEQIYDWLLEVDLGIKGNSALTPRTLLERLVVRLARPAA